MSPDAIGIVLVTPGGGAGTWQRVDGNFNPVSHAYGSSYFNSHPTYAGIVAETYDGQYLIKVPKFYVKTGAVPSNYPNAGKPFWMITNQASPGFAVHPAFMKNGSEISCFWVGKYQGTNWSDSYIGSQPGVKPLRSVALGTLFDRAAARGNGFMGWTIWQVNAIRLLALIEMGTGNSQSVMGQGHNHSYTSDDAKNTDDSVHPVWRGMVGLYGNCWQGVQGLKHDSSYNWSCWDMKGKKTFVAIPAPYKNSGYALDLLNDKSTDYDTNLLFLPKTSAEINSSTFNDHFEFYTGDRGYFAQGGTHYSSTTTMGLFSSWMLSSGDTRIDIGIRLAREV